MSPSGKAAGSGPAIRGFESLHPSQDEIISIKIASVEAIFYFSISKILNRDFAPFFSEILVFEMLNSSLKSLITARFAFPSTAGSRTKISKNSPFSSCDF